MRVCRTAMVTLLITSVLILGLIAIAVYFWQKPAGNTDTIELPQPAATSLFTTTQPEQISRAEDLPLTASQISEPSEGEDFEKRKAEANEVIKSWQQSPDRNSTANMLHIAALSDDAETYGKAVETALSLWQQGKIRDLSATELQTLITGEFWLLSSRTRSSGAGFVLKQTLSQMKRKLERANNPT